MKSYYCPRCEDKVLDIEFDRGDIIFLNGSFYHESCMEDLCTDIGRLICLLVPCISGEERDVFTVRILNMSKDVYRESTKNEENK